MAFDFTGKRMLLTGAGSGLALIPPCSVQNVENSERDPTTQTIATNAFVNYTCDPGYVHSTGDLIRHCVSVFSGSSSLNGTVPTCTLNNCTTEAANNTGMAPDQAEIDFNTTLNYTCNTGYNHTGGDLVRTCQANRTFDGVLPTCSIITCTIEGVDNAAKSPDENNIDYNKTITYTCNTGYNRTDGDIERTCTVDGTLNGTKPVCSIITCTIEGVDNAAKSPDEDNIDYNKTITYTCNTGYNRTDGDLERTCKADRALDRIMPVCSIINCTTENVDNAERSPDGDKIEYNTNLTYTCSTGYKRTAGDLERTCKADGTLDRTKPVCSIKQCSADNVTNASKQPAQSQIDYNQKVTYTCNEGYNRTDGNLERTCTDTEQLDGATPVCSIKKCLTGDVQYATKSPNTATVNYNTAITYTCDLGYNHTAGNLVRNCLSTAQLDGTTPVCSLIVATPPVSQADDSTVKGGFRITKGLDWNPEMANTNSPIYAYYRETYEKTLQGVYAKGGLTMKGFLEFLMSQGSVQVAYTALFDCSVDPDAVRDTVEAAARFGQLGNITVDLASISATKVGDDEADKDELWRVIGYAVILPAGLIGLALIVMLCCWMNGRNRWRKAPRPMVKRYPVLEPRPRRPEILDYRRSIDDRPQVLAYDNRARRSEDEPIYLQYEMDNAYDTAKRRESDIVIVPKTYGRRYDRY